MVKRPKSPEPIEDSKFLAVVHPFPLNANMDVPNDFKEFMYWLASIAGKDYALGAYYKPSVRRSLLWLLSSHRLHPFDPLCVTYLVAGYRYPEGKRDGYRRSQQIIPRL